MRIRFGSLLWHCVKKNGQCRDDYGKNAMHRKLAKNHMHHQQGHVAVWMGQHSFAIGSVTHVWRLTSQFVWKCNNHWSHRGGKGRKKNRIWSDILLILMIKLFANRIKIVIPNFWMLNYMGIIPQMKFNMHSKWKEKYSALLFS